MLRTHKQSWEDLASTDPLWAILSDPSKKNGRWNLEEFFERGEADIARALSHVSHEGPPRNHRRALDFGCGVGRLTRALSSRFQQCVGVDISAEMIAHAKRLNSSLPNCTFVTNTREDLRDFESASFDFIYSKDVLQHVVHRSTIKCYLQEFFRLLAPGGLLAFQLPSYISPLHRIQPVPRTYQFFRKFGVSHALLSRAGLHPIRMAFVPTPAVLQLARNAGMQLLESEDSAVHDVVSTFYWMTR